MKYFILTIFCNLLSSGHLQETKNAGDNLMKQDGGNNVGDWPVQSIHTIQGNFYGQAQRSVNAKPCLRRSNPESEHLGQRLVPTFTSNFVEPLANSDSANHKPRALRNEDHNFKPINNQEYSPTPLTGGNSLYKTRNSLSVPNPVIDSLEESDHGLAPAKNDKKEAPKELHTAASTEIESDPANAIVPKEYLSIIGNLIEPEYRSLSASDLHDQPTKELASEYVTTKKSIPNSITHTEPKKQDPVNQPSSVTPVSPNKCSDNKEHADDFIGHSRRSMSSSNDDQNGIEKEANKYDPYQESRIDNENAMASVLNAEPKLNTQRSNKNLNLSNKDKSKAPIHQSITRLGRPQFNENRRELIEPTKGTSTMGTSELMLLQTERICYACSTANNPTCWSPDRRTTVKYCRKGNNACITKTFGSGSSFTLIRDCGRSCDDSEMGGLMPRYKSCSMCHSELCNGAYSINGHSIIFATFLIALIKYLN